MRARRGNRTWPRVPPGIGVGALRLGFAAGDWPTGWIAAAGGAGRPRMGPTRARVPRGATARLPRGGRAAGRRGNACLRGTCPESEIPHCVRDDKGEAGQAGAIPTWGVRRAGGGAVSGRRVGAGTPASGGHLGVGESLTAFGMTTERPGDWDSRARVGMLIGRSLAARVWNRGRPYTGIPVLRGGLGGRGAEPPPTVQRGCALADRGGGLVREDARWGITRAPALRGPGVRWAASSRGARGAGRAGG